MISNETGSIHIFYHIAFTIRRFDLDILPNWKNSAVRLFYFLIEINSYYKKIQKYTGNNIDMIISLFFDLSKNNLKVIIK